MTALCASANDRVAHERINAALGGIAQLEKQVIDANAKFKGKGRKAGTRPAKRVEALEMQRAQTLEILEMGSKRWARNQTDAPTPLLPRPCSRLSHARLHAARPPCSNAAIAAELTVMRWGLQETACVFFSFQVVSQHCTQDSAYALASVQ